jgi:hypothetical protein
MVLIQPLKLSFQKMQKEQLLRSEAFDRFQPEALIY